MCLLGTTVDSVKRQNVPALATVDLGGVPIEAQADTSQNGDESKTATTKTATTKSATSPKRRHAKTATTKTATYPTRRQPKRPTCIQNGDTPKRRHPKRRHVQNGDTSKTATTKTANVYSKRRHTKTATNFKRQHCQNLIGFYKLDFIPLIYKIITFKRNKIYNSKCDKYYIL